MYILENLKNLESCTDSKSLSQQIALQRQPVNVKDGVYFLLLQAETLYNITFKKFCFYLNIFSNVIHSCDAKLNTLQCHMISQKSL